MSQSDLRLTGSASPVTQNECGFSSLLVFEMVAGAEHDGCGFEDLLLQQDANISLSQLLCSRDLLSQYSLHFNERINKT